MRVLLSTIGSRGDVQPLIALALSLKGIGEEARICAPPDFRDGSESRGIPFTAIGPPVRGTARAAGGPATPPTPEERRRMLEAALASQFETIPAAADGCDVIVGATALQVATPSIAEWMGVPYVFAAYCPAVLPSPFHPPPVLATLGDAPAAAAADNQALWERDAERWNQGWAEPLNAHRHALGLPPVADVRDHVLTGRPWLAADPTLAPWPEPGDPTVFQTGAWLLPDERPMSAELEAFLDAGDPPVYLGFGSSAAPGELARSALGAARSLEKRTVVSRGWAELSTDGALDSLTVGEVDHAVLFRRVAAVVHHGGAGTTTTAARAGAPQLLIPQRYDQHYWAGRVRELGIGVGHGPGTPNRESLTAALERALDPGVVARAGALAGRIEAGGADVAARAIGSVDGLGRGPGSTRP